MKRKFSNLYFVLLLYCPYLEASESELGYVFIGIFTCLPSLAFFICMFWLIVKFKNMPIISLLIMFGTAVGIAPFGINFTEYGAPYPNWIAYDKKMDIQIVSNVAILILSFLLYAMVRVWSIKNDKESS